jgi:DNA-binding PadR family transcriptional regulator
MPGIMKFETNNGPQKGILTIYLLLSLKRKPKSGYDLLSEIKEKTQGAWVPSKGTIYPLLKQLQTGGLIKVKTKEKRSKNIFEITPKGKKMIFNTKKQGENMMKIIMKFRNLILDIVEEDNEVVSTMMNIQNYAFELSKEKKYEVIKILRRCASDLEKEKC